MGIAEHMAAEQLQMFPHLAFSIESPTGIVQVDMLLGIQASILRGAKAIEGLGGIECRDWVASNVGNFCLNAARAVSGGASCAIRESVMASSFREILYVV